MIVLHVSCLCSEKYRATPVKPWLQAIFYYSGGRFIGSNGLGNRLSMTEDEGDPKIRRHYTHKHLFLQWSSASIYPLLAISLLGICFFVLYLLGFGLATCDSAE